MRDSDHAAKNAHGHLPRKGYVAERVPHHCTQLDDEKGNREHKALELRMHTDFC